MSLKIDSLIKMPDEEENEKINGSGVILLIIKNIFLKNIFIIID